MTHERIVRRQISGEINDDSDIPRMRYHFQHLLETSMRDEGLVPLLDIGPAFSLEYNNEHWSFVLTIHGVRVGKDSHKWQGMSEGKLLPRKLMSQEGSNGS